MSTHDFDPFALSSGLPLADVDATITAVDFRFDTSYAADACVAAITFQPDEGEPQEQLYSCGKGWEPLDRGASVGHTSGRQLNFNGQSNYGRFLAAALACEGFIDAARESGNTPHNAALWIGQRFHLVAETTETTNPSKPNDPPKIKSLIVPDAWYGEDGGDDTPAAAPAAAAPAKAAGAAKKAAAPRPGTAPAAAAPTSAIERKQIALIAELTAENEELVEELRALASEHATHEDFMQAAIELPAVAESELAQQVAMSSKAGSIWATKG